MGEGKSELSSVGSHGNLQLKGGVEQLLATVPPEFRPTTFNPTASVVRVLQSEYRDDDMEDLEDHFSTMERAMHMIVDGARRSPFAWYPRLPPLARLLPRRDAGAQAIFKTRC